MAIPLSMPNSDDIEDSHRLDLLLEQLLITLRQVLIHRRRVAAAAAVSRAPHVRHRHTEVTRTEEPQPEESTRVEEEEPSVQLPLPDLVMESSSSSASTTKEGSSGSCLRDRVTHRSRPDGTRWVEDGGELIRLAGQLLDQEDVDAESDEKVRGGEKMNVLSLMCPLLGNSVWTTVALLVVWGLLSRAR